MKNQKKQFILHCVSALRRTKHFAYVGFFNSSERYYVLLSHTSAPVRKLRCFYFHLLSITNKRHDKSMGQGTGPVRFVIFDVGACFRVSFYFIFGKTSWIAMFWSPFIWFQPLCFGGRFWITRFFLFFFVLLFLLLRGMNDSMFHTLIGHI